MFLLPGVAGFLFVPLAEAVVFAMIASFILSRTLVPTLANYLLSAHDGAHEREVMEGHDAEAGAKRSRNPLVVFQHGFEQRFEKIRGGYRDLLVLALANRTRFVVGFLVVVLLSFGLVPFLGRNFFPAIDAGQINLHVRGPTGTRIEQTAAEFDHIEQAIRQTIPPDQLGDIVDNIGLPFSGLNLAYSSTGTIGPQDGDILVSLKEGHGPTAAFVKTLRARLPLAFPGTTFAFLPADIISQILNFGAPAPIDVQITGPNAKANLAYAEEVMGKMRAVAGAADVRLQQAENYPELRVNVDRTRADQVGVTEKDVTTSLSTMLAGSGQTAPAYWLNPKNGVSYPIVAQAPQYRVDTLSDLDNVPVSSTTGGSQLLGAVAEVKRDDTEAVISHYAIAPAYDIYAAIQGRDLGAVAGGIDGVLKATARDLPKGALVHLRGQVTTMNSAFAGLMFGLLAAVVLIYLIVVVNFQSWLDPFVIITALPAALAGIVWMLFATGTTLSVPALTGAIMCMGGGDGQLHPGGQLLPRAARDQRRPHPGRAGGGVHPLPPGPHDRACDDHRHGAHGAGARRRRRAERAARPRGDRRPDLRHRRHLDVRAGWCSASSMAQRRRRANRPNPWIDTLRKNAPMPADAPASRPPGTPAPRRRGLALAGLIALIIAAGVVVTGIVNRSHQTSETRGWTRAQAIPAVSVVSPTTSAGARTLSLPGTLQAYYNAPIYSRVSGYVKAWYFDIGAHVKQGQLLAVIDTPETRPADRPGPRGRRHRPGQHGPRLHHRPALGAPAETGRRVPAGERGEGGRSRRQDRRGPGRQGQPRPAAGAEGLLAHHRAFRRRGDGAQDRHRRPGQRRGGGHDQLRTVRRGQGQPAAPVRPRAPGGFRRDQAGRAGHADGPGTGGPHLHGETDHYRRRHRRQLRHAAGRADGG